MGTRKQMPNTKRRGMVAPASRIDAVLEIVVGLHTRGPDASLPRRLGPLFRELALEPPPRDPDEIEDMIWAHWIAHHDVSSSAAMAAAIEAMGAGAFDLARPMLDRLVAREPSWAEAWNKRGTLAFVEKRDGDALADIEQTLLLEPRHFGAVSGFGQICLRAGRLAEARAAFQVALAINPHLLGVREAIEELGSTPHLRLH
jgi:tetratricopeptide (TPR) repeat protein